MWGLIIAIVSGALMSISGVFNAGVMKQSSMWVSATFVQFSAFIVSLGFWAFTGRGSFMDLFRIDNKYMLLGGVLGAFITYTVIRSVNELGPARANMFIITSQMIIAYLIEVFGLFGCERADFQWRKLIGVGIIVGGIIIFKWK